MVKRDAIKPGTWVKVSKVMPQGAHAGTSFKGSLALHERLEVVSKPFSRGPLNLVSVRRKKTGEQAELFYAFITNFCKLVDPAEPEVTADEVNPDDPNPKPDGG